MRDINNIIVSINFEQKTSKLVVNNGDTFKVWVDTIVNLDYYDMTISTDLSFVKESDYEYTITADVNGFNTIDVVVQNKDKSKTKKGNTLLAIVG